MAHTPSKYQQAIYSKFITTKSHIAISATAGSGKTSTLVELAKIIPYGKRALFMAFNKHIVNELKERLPFGVECLTMHSMGVSCIRKHYPGNITLNDNKQINIIMPFFDGKNPREKWKNIYEIDKVMKLARATMTEPNKGGIEKLLENYALDLNEDNISITVRALNKYYRNNDEEHYNFVVDYADMVQHCVRNRDIKMPQYDYVLIDESQDFSLQDQLFLERLVKPMTGRKILCGDKNQSIYSFRGASVTSFEDLANKPNTITLPLSISYRCAKAIVREAKKVYPEIEENPDGIEGIVRRGKIEEVQESDFVLCRNTRPLVEAFFLLIEQNKKAYIVGKDLEKGLLGIMTNFSLDDNLESAIEKIEGLKQEKVNELARSGIKNPKTNPKYLNYVEKIDIIELLFNKLGNVTEVEKWIESVFNDDERDGIMLSTIHRVKGMERKRVFFIETFEGKKLIPSQYAVTKDQLIQEKNLLFVCISRAKEEFVYLDL